MCFADKQYVCERDGWAFCWMVYHNTKSSEASTYDSAAIV